MNIKRYKENIWGKKKKWVNGKRFKYNIKFRFLPEFVKSIKDVIFSSGLS